MNNKLLTITDIAKLEDEKAILLELVGESEDEGEAEE